MREAGLWAKGIRRRALTTRRDPSHPVAPAILNRDVTTPEPNKKWGTDITSIPTRQGWLYLAVILDLYSQIVVGWSMSGNCDEELVKRALAMALARRRPQAGLLHHSDRGSQYISRAYRVVERALDTVVLPLEGLLVSLPHPQADLEHLLQPLVAFLQGRKGQP